jgi:hypothetical protein
MHRKTASFSSRLELRDELNVRVQIENTSGIQNFILMYLEVQQKIKFITLNCK